MGKLVIIPFKVYQVIQIMLGMTTSSINIPVFLKINWYKNNLGFSAKFKLGFVLIKFGINRKMNLNLVPKLI
ncbi:hypothetical protein IA05_01460 [Flavobacterium psychrophilum]|nr:hypothetical protein IA05_01460 [Flavobacterium psychrophilum]